MRLLTILTIFLLMSCNPLFCNWDSGYNHLKVQPSKEKLSGKFRLTEQSIEFLYDKGFPNIEYELFLNDNGQFKFINGPDLIFDTLGHSRQELKSKQGKWFVSCGDSSDCLIELEKVCVVPLAEKDGRLAILITIGDGDECNGLVYEKAD